MDHIFNFSVNFDLPSIGLASTDPGAILFEAYLKHSRKDYTFYDYIKCLGENMKSAVNQCLHIAAQSQDIEIQKAFLKVFDITWLNSTKISEVLL
jgi:hypothetical protein